MAKRTKIIVAAVVAAVLAIPVGTWVYINVIREDAPDRLSLDTLDDTTATTAAAGSTESTAGSGTNDGDVNGTWNATAQSQVGYRVKEVLFGQSTEAVGRTSDVTGTLEIDGNSVKAVTLTVDVASITSDSDRRDGQFNGRIMETSRFPTATFELTEPFDLPSVPTDETPISAQATGNLTLHGVTKAVTVDLSAKRTGGNIAVSGTIPVRFADYDIDNPSGGPAQVGDDGELEFLVVFAKA